MTTSIGDQETDWDNFAMFSQTDIDDTENKEILEQKNSNLDDLFQENFDNFENFLSENNEKNAPSVDNLVNNFEEGIVMSFHPTVEGHTNDESNLICPQLFETEILPSSKIWNSIVDNYGRVTALEWKTSQIQKQHLSSLNLIVSSPSHKKKFKENETAIEKESSEELDFHKMVDSDSYQSQKQAYFITKSQEHGGEVMQTADEVIEELEGMMLDVDLENAAVDYEVQQQTGIVFDDVISLQSDLDEGFEQCIHSQTHGSTSSLEESERAVDLKHTSLSDLNILNEELEMQVQLLSAELLQELNHRDELQFENEVKNTFISKVLEVQYKREQFLKTTNNNAALSLKNLSRGRKNSAADGNSTKGRFLTTVIPCNISDVITLDKLQVLIKILDAIKMDSDDVPNLLTSYILKVLCPSPAGHSNHVLEL